MARDATLGQQKRIISTLKRLHNLAHRCGTPSGFNGLHFPETQGGVRRGGLTLGYDVQRLWRNHASNRVLSLRTQYGVTGLSCR